VRECETKNFCGGPRYDGEKRVEREFPRLKPVLGNICLLRISAKSRRSRCGNVGGSRGRVMGYQLENLLMEGQVIFRAISVFEHQEKRHLYFRGGDFKSEVDKSLTAREIEHVNPEEGRFSWRKSSLIKKGNRQSMGFESRLLGQTEKKKSLAIHKRRGGGFGK